MDSRKCPPPPQTITHHSHLLVIPIITRLYISTGHNKEKTVICYHFYFFQYNFFLLLKNVNLCALTDGAEEQTYERCDMDILNKHRVSLQCEL